MTITSEPKLTSVLLALLLALTLVSAPAIAQEDETGDDDEGWGKLIFEAGVWVAQPTGLDDQVASIADPVDLFNTQLVAPSHGTATEGYYRFGAELARNKGRVLVTWYGNVDEASLNLRDPGNFIYGEILALPFLAGLANDGLADAVDANNRSVLRDQRIDYSRIAFTNSRVEARWFTGYRRITYTHSTDVTYHALVPTFPAFVLPLTDALPHLTPIADTVQMTSRFEGRGLSAGMEFEAPLFRDKLAIEAGFNIAIMRGHSDSRYQAVNSLYVLNGLILEAPYTELGDYTIDPTLGVIGTATSVDQLLVGIGLRSNSLSRTSQVMEANLGARWHALAYMDAFFGFRMTNYTNVGVELRPTSVVIVGSAVNATNATQIDRSATYEGFYAGVGFHF